MLAAGYPNPFTTSTRLTYQVPDARTVRIQVFDLLGRKVRTLVQGSTEAGRHTVTWDGRDDAGRRVASGTYLCRMQAGDHVAVQSLVVAR
jgi:flagellar hook assembly protein FlgD